MVREEGLEPSRPCEHRHLKPACLPIPPLAPSEDWTCYRGCTVPHMVFRRIEEGLEAIVEGMFGRVFRSELQPVEIARGLIRHFDTHKAIDATGQLVGPNHFVVGLNPGDFDRLSAMAETIARDAASRVRASARAEGAGFVGPVAVDLNEDASVRLGRLSINSTFDESAHPTVASSWLELPDGNRIDLPPRPVTLGRLPESDIVLDDPNCSRRHAELQPEGDSYTLVDLGSTNGSSVNGALVTRQVLLDGDTLAFGVIVATFRQA